MSQTQILPSATNFPRRSKPASVALSSALTPLLSLALNFSQVDNCGLSTTMVNFSPPPFPSGPDENSQIFLSSNLLSESFTRASGLDPVLSNTSQLLTGTASYKSTAGMDPQPVSSSVTGAAIDIPLGSLLLLNNPIPTSSSSARRARSGSLFSTNSIWNDDALLLNSPSRALLNSGILDLFPEMAPSSALGAIPSSASSFISPVLSAQPSSLAMANPTRNRSHTTSNHSIAFGVKPPVETTRLSASPFLLAVQEPSSLLDNMLGMGDVPVSQAPRNRSQTHSGVTPKLSDASLVMPSFSRLSQHQNMGPIGTQLQFGDPANQSFDFPLNFATKEILQDDFDIFDLSITTSFDNPNLGPTNTLLLDNLPHFIDAAGLHKLLNNPTNTLVTYHNAGITSVRVSQRTNSKLALVECVSIEAAMNIKASFNHLELMPGVILYVAFAKVGEPLLSRVTNVPVLVPAHASALNGNGSIVEQSQPQPQQPTELRTIKNSLRASPSGNTVESLMDTVSRLSASQPIDLKKVVSIIKKAAAYPKNEYQQSFGTLPEPMLSRQFDAPKLREMRKSLESCEKVALGLPTSDSESTGEGEIMTQYELEELCLSILDELPEICYDHIGNTVVQKLFTVVESPVIKLIMIKEIALYFAQLGIHKNGTWAIQKIINNSVDSCPPKVLIAKSLKPYAVKLFNDQFGNYVLQCCLKFGSPFNDFIFETVYDNFLEISCGRFGARCLRAILETSSENNSSHGGVVSSEQLFFVASLIVENALELVVNNNGSLLITWFLDTFSGCKNAEYDFRYGLLCDKLMPTLDLFCTHKLGSLTIYKILNNRIDTSVKLKIMDTIFGIFNEQDYDQGQANSEVLESILQDFTENNSGPLFIYKILTNPSSFCIGSDATNQRYHQFVISQVKRVLMDINIVNQQPYKKLMDEVGLSPNKLNKSMMGSRKTKRGANIHQGMNNRINNGKTGPNNFGMAMQYPHANQMGPPMMHYNNTYPTGAHNMYAPPQTQVYGGQFNGAGFNFGGQYNNGMMQQAQHEQDFSVMHDLEQLSLSSAAKGYGSNPQTPLASVKVGQDGLFF